MPKTSIKRVVAPAQHGAFVYRQQTTGGHSFEKESLSKDFLDRVQSMERKAKASHR
jgi:hypothetical protein